MQSYESVTDHVTGWESVSECRGSQDGGQMLLLSSSYFVIKPGQETWNEMCIFLLMTIPSGLFQR